MSEELKKELRMLGVLDYKTPTRENDTAPIWVRDDVTFDDNGEPNFQERAMINRDVWLETLDKCKEDYKVVRREADMWEREAKRLLEENHKLKAQLKLWKGTGL